MVRIWEAIRIGSVRAWGQERAGHWDKAIAGSSALKAALIKAMRCEGAVAQELLCAEGLLDMDKFYDSMSPLSMIRIGRKLKDSLRVLALETQLNIAPRVLVAGDACSHAQCIANSTLPGARFANSLTRVYLYEAIEQTLQANPWASVEQYVDNIVIQTLSEAVETTAERQVMTIEDFIKGVQRLRRRVSAKSQGLASTERLKRRMARKLAKKGLPL